MATFTGTSSADRILRDSLSLGVVTDPAGLTGTADGGDNVVYGEGGDDVIEAGGRGPDLLYGGEGNDRLVSGEGRDELYGDVGGDVLIGSGGDDSLIGGTGRDTLRGGAGDDYLGSEYAGGPSGADRMFGDAGSDRYVVDSRGDVIVERPDQGFDTVHTTLASYTLGANIEALNLPETVDLDRRFTGNALDNVIAGEFGSDVLRGLDGNDQLDGGWDGSDTLLGGRGDDTLAGGDGSDPDVLRGQAGNDALNGTTDAAGADVLVGGRGRDSFNFEPAVGSTPETRSAIEGGDGAIAFEGAGRADGDMIALFGWAITLKFGETGKGGVSCVNRGEDTLVRVNLDNDTSFEFDLLIRDGGEIRASAYTARDFMFF